MNKLIGVLGVGMIVLIGLCGYGIYDVQQSRIAMEEKQWQQEQERKDLVAKCSSEAVDKSVEVGKKLDEKFDSVKSEGGSNDAFDQLLSEIYGPLIFATSYKGEDEYSYKTYQDNYSVCMQSHGVDLDSL